MLHPADNVLLIFFVQFNKIPAPTPDTHNQVAIVLRIFLGSQQCIAIDDIQLKLLPPPYP